MLIRLGVLVFIAAALWHMFRGGLRHDYKEIEQRGWEEIERLREQKRDAKLKAKLAKHKTQKKAGS